MSDESNTPITVFSWDVFPVEREKFSVCICIDKDSNDKEKKDLDKLINFIKIVFPEKITDYTELTNINYKKSEKKETVLLNLKSSTKSNTAELLKSSEDWVAKIQLLQLYIEKGHSIIIGEYENIPKIVLTMCDLLIFDNENTINKYLTERHNSKISNFNSESHYILVDKRRLKLNIHGIEKTSLDRYF